MEVHVATMFYQDYVFKTRSIMFFDVHIVYLCYLGRNNTTVPAWPMRQKISRFVRCRNM